jgi:hypothetical protein
MGRPMRFTSKSFHVLTKEQRQTIRSRFSIGQWKMAVANDKTIAGYVEWLANGIAASVDETVPYFDLDSRNNPVFISDRVSCSSKDGDFNHEFVGTVIGFKSNNRGPFYVEVRDQDGNVYDCDPSQVTIEEDLLEETKLQSRALGPNQAAALRALREHRVWPRFPAQASCLPGA